VRYCDDEGITKNEKIMDGHMVEANNTKQDTLQWRGLTILVMTLAFLVLATTGEILYITPQGRVANRTGWNVLRLSKKRWVSVHITASLLFFIASGFHVYFNWRTLVRYLLLKRRLLP
jgi:Domain of unknown function (DUF4405)